MPYLVHGKLEEESLQETLLLIEDVHFILVTSALITPFTKIFDFNDLLHFM